MADREWYDWGGVFSRQTGTNGEIALVIGGKGIGKTFNLRRALTDRAIKSGGAMTFCEICRSNDEARAVSAGYFDQLQAKGYFKGYVFKVEKLQGFAAPESDGDPIWVPVCYFVSLTMFQREKKRTFANVCNIIFDEFIIDKKDRHHRYLPNEYSILANLADTIFRQQPGDERPRHIFMLANACDLTCPYLRHLGIDRPPAFGFTWYRGKTVLLHFVEPWDAEDRKAYTLVGRMLAGDDEAAMVFDNAFDVGSVNDIRSKTPEARYSLGIVFQAVRFGIWIDYSSGLVYINDQIPRGSKNIYSLTKKDGTIDYMLVQRNDSMMQTLVNMFYRGLVRYSSPAIREAFLEVLGFLGVK